MVVVVVVCANCRLRRKGRHTHYPQFCTRDVDRQFGGGGAWIYTEQMDAEGLGRKLLLTASGDPRRAPEK